MENVGELHPTDGSAEISQVTLRIPTLSCSEAMHFIHQVNFIEREDFHMGLVGALFLRAYSGDHL